MPAALHIKIITRIIIVHGGVAGANVRAPVGWCCRPPCKQTLPSLDGNIRNYGTRYLATLHPTLQPYTLPCNPTPYLAALHATLQPCTLPCILTLYLASLRPTLQPTLQPYNLLLHSTLQLTLYLVCPIPYAKQAPVCETRRSGRPLRCADATVKTRRRSSKRKGMTEYIYNKRKQSTRWGACVAYLTAV